MACSGHEHSVAVVCGVSSQRWLHDGEMAARWLRDGCEWISRASARISCVWKRVESVACDKGEMAVHLRGMERRAG